MVSWTKSELMNWETKCKELKKFNLALIILKLGQQICF